MKKNIISGVILLMTISLVGIIVVQFFWIKNAIEIKEKQFDRTVNDALVEIVEKFDKDKNIFFVKEQLKSSSPSAIITIDHDNDMNYTYSYETDSLLWVDESNDEDRVIVKADGKTHVKTMTYDGGNTTISVHSEGDEYISLKTIVKLDSLKEQLNEQQYIVISEFRDSVDVLFRNKVKQIAYDNEDIEDVIDEMVIELKDLNESEDLSENQDLLALRIKETLEDKGIKQAFEFAVSNPTVDTSIIIHSSGYIQSQLPDYKTRLYPKRIFHKPELLLLSLPDKNAHIYRSVSWLMSGSLIFTLIIIITFYVTIRIILQQKKLSEIKTDFINNMTHEFKTPIATISLAVDSIQNKSVISKPDKIMYFTDIIHEENKRMNSRVENILQMSLIDKSDFNFQFEKADLHEIIKQAAKNIELQLKQKDGELNLHLDADSSIMLLDKVHLLNIFTNLLDNAVKYSDERIEISVTTLQSDNNITISVKDKGMGISKEVQHKIFDKFFRVSKGDIHNVKGFGLGLSYVKAVILALNGSIDVKSEPGKGAEFIIKLPVNS